MSSHQSHKEETNKNEEDKKLSVKEIAKKFDRNNNEDKISENNLNSNLNSDSPQKLSGHQLSPFEKQKIDINGIK